MKFIKLLLLFIPLAFSLSAQDLTIQSDFVFEIKEGFAYQFDAEKVYLRPHITIYSTEARAKVDAVLVNELDQKIMTIATVNYEGQTLGAKNKLLNFDELNAAFKVIDPLNKAMLNVDKQINVINKLLATADEKEAAKLKEANDALSLLSTDYALKLMDIGLPPEEVWSYDLTYGLFQKHFDWQTQQLTAEGVSQLLSTTVLAETIFDEAINDFDEKYKYGIISDYVNESPIIKHHTVRGDGFIEDGCRVLYEGETLDVKSRLTDITYTLGRGKCKGRTNNNGDKFVIVGDVLSFTGLSYDKGFYTVLEDSFSITIKNDFSILKGDEGQYMVFDIQSSTNSK